MLDDLVRERRRKLDRIRAGGKNPYPIKSSRDFSIAHAVGNFSSIAKSKKAVNLVGRVRSLRDQGGLIFVDIDDGSDSIQVVVSKKNTHHFEFWKGNVDVGDFVETRGRLFKTKRGERSVEAVKFKVISKSLRPLPEKWHGLKDEEEKLRKRYIDIIFEEDVKDAFVKRSELVRKLREFLWKEGFMEVETPMLQPIPGGALARPFVTHHNALKQDLYLRVAPELYLKRLLVAGFDKVFEMGRIFRNEGMDRDHNPEFTMLELYWAYQDAKGMISFVKKMIRPFVKGPWQEISYAKAFEKYAGKKVDFSKHSGNELDEMFKKHVRPKLIKPTVVYDIPKSLSPLSKSKEDDPLITDRFFFLVDGTEIVNGFSELNDPDDQRERMEEQERRHRKGDQEASRLDEDFLEALEYGMPPAAGIGIGIDRLAAIYANRHSVKDVIIFPTLRSKRSK